MQDGRGIDLVEELAPYVPPLVVRYLAEVRTTTPQAAAEIYSAAVLFVDITAYSAFAESLSDKESEGVEELAFFLNECFGQLIQIIREHGGEVTKFAGDALVAIWPVPHSMARVGRAAREKLSDLVLLAAQCALAIQEESSDFFEKNGGDTSLRIGIAAGDIYAVHLGGVLGRWEFLLSGEPLVQMSLAKDLAEAGEVVLDPTAWSMVEERCAAELTQSNFARVKTLKSQTPPQLVQEPQFRTDIVERMQSYVPAAITRRLDAGFGSWLSEIRYLTILFVKLPGYGTSITHPYATTIPEAQAVMRAMQYALYRFEGSINKFNVDDKGITLVAAMGLPPLAHKDDAARAVQVSLEMQRVLNALDRPCAIGVASGQVFCGPIGSEDRREYTVVGNSVNRAASLMQVAEKRRTGEGLPSYVLCDEETHDDINRGVRKTAAHQQPFTFERLGGVMLKGRETPVTAFRPHLKRRRILSVPNILGDRVSFIGRREERRSLKSHVRALTQSDSFLRVLVVEGEEGIGKTALVHEALVDASTYDVRIVTGAGIESEQKTAYHAWRSIFTQIFDIDIRFDDLGSQRRKVMRSLPALPGEKGYPALALRLTPLLNPVLGLEFSENRLTRSMSPEVREQSTRLFLIRLLQQSFYDARRHLHVPHVVFLDNGQWLDEESWRLAVTVTNLVRPLLLVVASRPLRQDALGRPPLAACTELLMEDNLERGRVELMFHDDMTRLHADLVEPCSLSVELEEALWSFAGGNPYLASRIVEHWRSLDLICVSTDDGGAIDSSVIGGAAPIPSSVKKLVAGRVDRLAPEQQMIVKAASSFSDAFSEGELNRLLGAIDVEMDIKPPLDSLVELQLLQETGGPEKVSYQFSYELIRDVTQDLLTKDQRQVLQSAALMAS